MKLTKEQLKGMIKEALEQAGWEKQQSAMPFDKKLGMTTALFNVINDFLATEGRQLVRVPQSKLDNLLLQIIELSQPKR